MFALGLSYMAFLMLRYVPSIPAMRGRTPRESSFEVQWGLMAGIPKD